VTDTDTETASRKAGRGGIAVLGAKAFFIVIGLVQQTLLPRAIGLAGYGALSRVMAVANVLNNVVVATSIQGVSRAVARAPGHEGRALREALRVHVPIAMGLALVFAASSPLIAAFQHAPHIALPLAAAAGVTLLYGIYAPLVGSLNGRALFTRQAGLDVTAAVLRTAGLVALGKLFLSQGLSGALGAVVGAAIAAMAILPLALRWARTRDTAEEVGKRALPASVASRRAYVAELLPLAFAQLFTNALMQIDITLLGRFLSQSAHAGLQAGMSGGSAIADEWVAVYRTCQLFAFLPYQLLMSITQVLFPMLARAKAEGNRDAVTLYVARGARLGALACGLLVGIVAALPGPLLNLAFGSVVAGRGASTLRVLAIGQGAFTLFGIANTVLTSLGRERLAATVSLGALTCVAAACTLVVPSAPFGEPQLFACATATTCALVASLGMASLLVHRETSKFLPLATVMRVCVAVAVLVGAGMYLPHIGKLATPVIAAGLGVVYVAVLVGLRELTGGDLEAFRATLARRKR
jgi:stage V sporulation protein B